MEYLVIDLEMCKVAKCYSRNIFNHGSEIIQIGAVLLDEEYKQTAVLRQYIHPVYGVIDNYIQKLTGIGPENVKNAPVLEEGLKRLMDLTMP